MTEVVYDQYGEPWLMIERNGSQWVLGFDDERMPIMRFLGGREFHTDLATPRGVRKIIRSGSLGGAPKIRLYAETTDGRGVIRCEEASGSPFTPGVGPL